MFKLEKQNYTQKTDCRILDKKQQKGCICVYLLLNNNRNI